MHQVAKITFIILLALAASACQTRPTTAVVTVSRPALTVPPVDSIKMRAVNWHVVSKNAKPGQPGHVDEAFRKSNSTSLFAVSARNYENISVNTANLLRVIKQYQTQVRAYRDYYSGIDPQQNQGSNNVGQAARR